MRLRFSARAFLVCLVMLAFAVQRTRGGDQYFPPPDIPEPPIPLPLDPPDPLTDGFDPNDLPLPDIPDLPPEIPLPPDPEDDPIFIPDPPQIEDPFPVEPSLFPGDLIDDFPPPPILPPGNQAQVAGATRPASSPATNVVMSLMPFPRPLLFRPALLDAPSGQGTPLACDPVNQTRLLVAESKRDSLAFLNTCPLKIVARVPVGTKPVNVVRIPDTSVVLVANSGSASLSVVDTATQKVTTTIPLPPFAGFAAQPSAMAIQPDGSLAYVSLHLAVPASVVYIIDLTTMQYTGQMLDVGAFPASMALTPDGSQLWVSSRGDSRVDIFDTATNTHIFAFNVQLATGIAFNPTGTRAFMAEGISPGDVIVIDVQTLSQVAIIPVGNFPHALKVSSTGRHLFVTNALSNSISLVDAVNNTVLRTINLRAQHPLGLAFVGKAPF